MTNVELLLWWQCRYPRWASVTAPLVRHFVETTVQSLPLKTVLRLTFVRFLWRNESISTSNASSRLSNIYDCSAATVIEDLLRVGIQPLAEFVRRYPTQASVSEATLSMSSAATKDVIQDVSDFDKRLTEYHRVHEAEINEAVALVEATCPTHTRDVAPNLNPKQQDDLCFEWSHYLAIADALEFERRKLVKFVKPDSAPPKVVAEKCAQFSVQLEELLEYTRKDKPPHVLRTWLDAVETWIQHSRLAFPVYQSADEVRRMKKQSAWIRYEELLDGPSRQRLASIGDFTPAEDGKYGLKVTYKNLKELAVGWAPMSLQVQIGRDAKQTGFTESDKSRILDALRRFAADITLLQANAIAYARAMNFELSLNGIWVAAHDLTDDQLLRSVKKITLQVSHPHSNADELKALLELDCDWDPEHGVCFGLLSNNEIVLQPGRN